MDRDAAHGQAPGAVGIAAVRGYGGVAVYDLYVFHGDAESICGYLRPGRDVALAVGRGAGYNLHLARAEHPHGGRLPAGAQQAHRRGDLRGGEAAALGEVTDPDPDLPEVPGFAATLLLGAHLFVLDERQGLAHAGFVVAGVVLDAGGGHSRFVEGWHQVLQPQLRRVHFELAGEGVHDPLVGVGGLGAPGAAVGVCRGEVGEHAGALEGVGVEGVEARVGEGAEDGDAGAEELQVGAHVGQKLHLHAEDLALVRRGELYVLDLPTAVGGGQVVLGAVLDPRQIGRAHV